TEAEDTAWREGLCLHKIIAQAANVGSPFQSMVAADLRPTVHNIDICFPTVPGLGGRITYQRVVRVPGDADAGYATGEIIEICAGDANRVSIFPAKVGIARDVPVVINSYSSLNQQSPGEGVGMIKSAALLVLNACTLKAALTGTTRRDAKDRLFVDILHRPAEAERQAIIVFALMINLYVERCVVLEKARVVCEIIRGLSSEVFQVLI